MLSEEQRDALKAEFGEQSVIVDKDMGCFVFKKPSAIHWERYQETLMSDNKKVKKGAAFAQLCRDCLVSPKTAEGRPDLAAFTALSNEYPAIATTICGELADLAGAGESHVGKL